MRKALCAALLAAMGTYMAPASAVTIASTTSLGDLTGVSAAIGRTFSAADYQDSFVDDYNFSLTAGSQVVGTTVTINLSVGANTFQLSNMMATLSDSTGATVYALDNTLDASNALQVSATVGSGAYRLRVTGDVTGNLGGGYGGVLQAAPVPEAQTYAMLLAGLVLVGFMARRNARVSV